MIKQPNKVFKGQELIQHFKSKFIINSENNCWEWIKPEKYGYGRYYHNYKHHQAHRFSWILFKGQLENSNIYVCHSCDNKKCVNPDHLWLGDAKSNFEDSKLKKRHHQNKSKFTLDQQNEIRIKYKQIQSIKKIAKKYNVSKRLIWNILNPEKRKLEYLIKGK